jgi:hypothetical protein
MVRRYGSCYRAGARARAVLIGKRLEDVALTYMPKLFKVVPTVLVLGCLAIPATASAANILFARVGAGHYVADGAQLVGFLTDAGHTVDYVDLSAGVITDFSAYSQVWVYDLVDQPDNSATQNANYANIANWYNGLTAKNLITDGRIISSAPFWTSAGGFPAENAWIQNYATQLALHGGGLVLGTDHDVYQSGINTINALIGINPFSGFFGSFPTSQAQVDALSPLYVAIGPCVAAPALPCINDNSTTGFVPTGIQPNGQFLTPVAYHGTTSTAFANAAVSTTFGSVTFPDPTIVPEPASLLLLGSGLAAVARRRYKSRA